MAMHVPVATDPKHATALGRPAMHSRLPSSNQSQMFGIVLCDRARRPNTGMRMCPTARTAHIAHSTQRPPERRQRLRHHSGGLAPLARPAPCMSGRRQTAHTACHTHACRCNPRGRTVPSAVAGLDCMRRYTLRKQHYPLLHHACTLTPGGTSRGRYIEGRWFLRHSLGRSRPPQLRGREAVDCNGRGRPYGLPAVTVGAGAQGVVHACPLEAAERGPREEDGAGPCRRPALCHPQPPAMERAGGRGTGLS